MAFKIWENDDKIFFYFDESQLIIYPIGKDGFDKIFARIHVLFSSKTIDDDVSQYFVFLKNFIGNKLFLKLPNKIIKRKKCNHSIPFFNEKFYQ